MHLSVARQQHFWQVGKWYNDNVEDTGDWVLCTLHPDTHMILTLKVPQQITLT